VLIQPERAPINYNDRTTYSDFKDVLEGATDAPLEVATIAVTVISGVDTEENIVPVLLALELLIIELGFELELVVIVERVDDVVKTVGLLWTSEDVVETFVSLSDDTEEGVDESVAEEFVEEVDEVLPVLLEEDERPLEEEEMMLVLWALVVIWVMVEAWRECRSAARLKVENERVAYVQSFIVARFRSWWPFSAFHECFVSLGKHLALTSRHFKSIL
jgi:hypothetical protein